MRTRAVGARFRVVISVIGAMLVSGGRGAWEMRTYERGVEDETLACGTGSVATAMLLREWDLDDSPVVIKTRSGADVRVTVSAASAPRLRGEGRLVFEGTVADIPETGGPNA